MRLIFVRHGEPDYENDRLTENGIIQAECTAKRLHNEPVKAVFSSPMGRARQTASFTAKDHGLDVRSLDFMHEIDWGGEGVPYEGHPWTLACRMYAEGASFAGGAEWEKHPYFGSNVCMDYYHMIAEKFDEFLNGFGFERRDGIYYCHKKCEDTIALFAHGGSGAVMFSHVFGLPFPFVLASLPYGVCSVSVMNFESNVGEMTVPRMELFNDMGHIEKLKPERLKFEK